MDTDDKLKKYKMIWERLNLMGFDKKTGVPYYCLYTCCDQCGLERTDMDIKEFEKIYGVSVG